MVSFSSLSDNELHKLVFEGSIEAEEELATRYIRLPRSVARQSELFLPGAEHEDLIQEGTIGLLYAIRTFEPESNTAFVTYAYRCIENRLLSAVRSAVRQKNRAMNESVSLNAIMDTSFADSFAYDNINSDPELLVMSKENLAEIEKQISSMLSDNDNTVLRLYLEGHSYREIAAQLGKDIKFTDNAVQRIRKKLRRAIDSGVISIS